MEELLLFGIFAPLWMLFGVAWVASRYPGYSHMAQVMSELGARSRPTEQVQPLVNNFPIGVLFSAFGLGVHLNSSSWLYASIGGVLLIIHGGSHIITGIFPCDADLGRRNPSTAQNIHNIAGSVMYFSVFGACILSLFPSSGFPSWFRWYSLGSSVASAAFLFYMVQGLKGGPHLGLHQRLSYGVLALWCAVLAVVLTWA